jgi:hypothetical protein
LYNHHRHPLTSLFVFFTVFIIIDIAIFGRLCWADVFRPFRVPSDNTLRTFCVVCASSATVQECSFGELYKYAFSGGFTWIKYNAPPSSRATIVQHGAFFEWPVNLLPPCLLRKF